MEEYSLGDIILYGDRLGKILRLTMITAKIQLLDNNEELYLPYSSFFLPKSQDIELGVMPGKSFPVEE